MAAGTTLTVAGSLDPHRRQHQHRDGRGRGADQPGLDVRREHRHAADRRDGRQTFTGAATTAAGNLPNVVINKPSGTLTLVGTIRTTHNWTYTAGTVDAGTSLVVFAGSTVTSVGMTFYDVTANGGTTTLGSAMAVGHNLTVSAGTFTTSASNYGLSVVRQPRRSPARSG